MRCPVFFFHHYLQHLQAHTTDSAATLTKNIWPEQDRSHLAFLSLMLARALREAPLLPISHHFLVIFKFFYLFYLFFYCG